MSTGQGGAAERVDPAQAEAWMRDLLEQVGVDAVPLLVALLHGDPDLALEVVDGLQAARPWRRRLETHRGNVAEEWERIDVLGEVVAEVYEYSGHWRWVAVQVEWEVDNTAYPSREEAMAGADGYLREEGYALSNRTPPREPEDEEDGYYCETCNSTGMVTPYANCPDCNDIGDHRS